MQAIDRRVIRSWFAEVLSHLYKRRTAQADRVLAAVPKNQGLPRQLLHRNGDSAHPGGT
jgi:hypothetical protein